MQYMVVVFGIELLCLAIVSAGFIHMSTINNERTKYTANAFDRASTSYLTVGVFAPIAAALYTSASAQVRLLPFMVAVLSWLFTAVILHLSGKYVLRRLL
jgi:hypothetical protein